MYGEESVCDKWVPSLFNPILLVSDEINIKYIKYGEKIINVYHELRYPFLDHNKRFNIILFSSVIFGNYKLYLGSA